MNFDQTVNFRTRTAGDGNWSSKRRFVTVNRVQLAYIDNEGSFGELRAKFDTADWDTDNDGLIYSDSGWIESFKTCMVTLGFGKEAVDDITYSEAGMQGENFVSMDVGPAFIQECDALYRFVVNKQAINI